MFAKLYEVEGVGQILVKLGQGNEDVAAVKIYCQPSGLGVCALSLGFSEWEKAEELFEAIDEAQATRYAQKLIESAQPFCEECSDTSEKGCAVC